MPPIPPWLVEKRGLLISFALALITTFAVVSWMSQEQKKSIELAEKRFAQLQANSIDVVIAKTNIPENKLISEDMVYAQSMPKDKVPPEAATSLLRVVDRVATQPIKKDAMIMNTMLSWPTTQETTLAMKTPIGKRAIAIPVDNISSLVGMIKPGDYVDVITLIALPVIIDGKQSAQPATVPLFQNVPVLAVGSQIGGEAAARKRREEGGAPAKDSAPLITLALTPEEVNLLAFVQEQGKIRLVLRSPGDAKTTQAVQPASWETLLKYLYPNLDLSKPEVKEEPKVEVIRGFKKEMMPLIQKK